MRRAVLAGVLAGAIAGLIAVALTVPLRRAVSVTDRTIINGFSVTLGAIVLWTAAGIAYAVQASRSTSAQRWLLIAAAGAAVAISAFVAADIGPLAPYPPHFASLAIPIWLMITTGVEGLAPNRKTDASGKKCPNSDGPSNRPATISPMTPGWPSRRDNWLPARAARIMAISWSSVMKRRFSVA